MGTRRIEAFSDGVIAIIITVMVLDLRVPRATTLDALIPVVPALLTYLLSFLYLGIYWSNHHHLLHTIQRVSGGILWANLHLLFWLSLIPFTTAWMGASHFAAVAWWILQQRIIALQGRDSLLKAAIGRDWKGKLSPAPYLIAIVAATRIRWVSLTLYAVVALLWLIPDRRIERALGYRSRRAS